MSASRLAPLVFAAACAPAARPTPIANTSATRLDVREPHLAFTWLVDEHAAGDRTISFTFAPPLTDLQVAVFDLTRGALAHVRAEALAYRGEYEATLPPAPNLGPIGTLDIMAVVAAPPRGLAVAPLAPSDVQAVEQLRDSAFVAVEAAASQALDLDGDRRPDLAFLDVCREPLSAESTCDRNATYAVLRRGDGWRLLAACLDLSSAACETARATDP